MHGMRGTHFQLGSSKAANTDTRVRRGGVGTGSALHLCDARLDESETLFFQLVGPRLLGQQQPLAHVGHGEPGAEGHLAHECQALALVARRGQHQELSHRVDRALTQAVCSAGGVVRKAMYVSVHRCRSVRGVRLDGFDTPRFRMSDSTQLVLTRTRPNNEQQQASQPQPV